MGQNNDGKETTMRNTTDKAKPENYPYVGPRSFSRKEAEFFFGRNTESRDLLSLIAAHSLVVLHSQSGAGKSSLLNTKVFTRTQSSGTFPHFEIDALPVTTVHRGIPKGVSTEELRKTNIYSFNVKSGWISNFFSSEKNEELNIKLKAIKKNPEEIRNDLLEMTLAGFLEEYQSVFHPNDDRPLVMVIDQFEEIFTAYPSRWNQREKFFKQLGEVLENSQLRTLRVVLSMREEFLGQLDQYSGLFPRQAQICYRLERLRKKAALLAIKEPAASMGCTFADDAAQLLVNSLLLQKVTDENGQLIQAEGEFVEPVFLQVVCYNIWEKLKPKPGDVITADDVRRWGNVDNALTGLYEDAIDAAKKAVKSEEPDEILRIWCERCLITPIKTRGIVIEGVTDTAGLPNEAVRILENRRLIRAVKRGGTRWYELTHDTLIQPILDSNSKMRFWAGIPGTFSGESLKNWLRFQEKNLLKHRKLRLYQGKTFEQLVESIPNSHEDEMLARTNAELLLASYILNGKIHLIHQVPESGYYLLENLWLEKVKEFAAYFNWEDNPNHHSVENYFEACQILQKMLLSSEIKPYGNTAIQMEFETVKTYLETNYVSNTLRHHLLEKKKQRYESLPSQLKPKNSTNRKLAETYVYMYYDHIIPAVMEQNEDDILMVLKALQYGEPHAGYWVANAFEAAIAIYFLDPAIMKVLWSTGQERVLPLQASVRVNLPTNVEIPKFAGLKILFDPERNTLSCSGVMRRAQKDILVEQLQKRNTDKSVQQAIEMLFTRSRLVYPNQVL
jgi:hypothetical protein